MKNLGEQKDPEYEVDVRAAVERIRHKLHSQGQVMALCRALSQVKVLKLFEVVPSSLNSGMVVRRPERSQTNSPTAFLSTV